jgi:hypothetical protein
MNKRNFVMLVGTLAVVTVLSVAASARKRASKHQGSRSALGCDFDPHFAPY